MGLMSKYGVSQTTLEPIIVANAAALSAYPDSTLLDGARARVLSYRDDFDLVKTSTLALTANVVLATLSGVGRWIRREIPHPLWELQASWDLNFTTGNDENLGTALAPLKTWDELIRRVGFKHDVTVSTTITLQASMGAGEVMRGDWNIKNGVRFVVQGATSAAFTGVISALQNLNPATNQETQATSTWAPAGFIGRLVHDITANRFTWIAKDLGANNARLSPWTNINEATGGTTVSTGNSAINNDVEILTLPIIPGFQFTIRGTAGGTTPAVFQKLEFTAASGTPRFFGANSQAQFQNVKFSGTMRFGGGIPILNNCCFATGDGAYSIDTPGNLRINSGLSLTTWGTASRPQEYFEFRSDHMWQASVLNILSVGSVRIDSGWFFDNVDSINVTKGSYLLLNGSLNGYGNTGTSIVFEQGSNGSYIPAQVFGIVSAANDITVGGLATAFVFDPAVGAHVFPAVATTFANLVAATPAGFGGALVDPKSGVRMVAAV